MCGRIEQEGGVRRPTEDTWLERSSLQPEKMRWGWQTHSGLLLHARLETLGVKPLFRERQVLGRAVLKIDAFHEGANRICAVSGAPLRVAALWRAEPEADGRASVPRFVVVTQEASEGALARVHDRMPVLLSPEESGEWLQATDSELLWRLRTRGGWSSDRLQIEPLRRSGALGLQGEALQGDLFGTWA